MSDKHFDVVVLGTSVAALSLAAVLCRRDFSVLVVGNAAKPATYQFRDYTLYRRLFSPLAVTSIAFKRILTELAQTQVFRRKMRPLDPMLTLMLPDRRFEIAPQLALVQEEIDREFSDVRRAVDLLYEDTTRVNAATDTAFERDLIWPPGTFFERRATRAAAANIPFLLQQDKGLFEQFPPGHPFPAIVEYSARVASHLAPGTRSLHPFATARLHGMWTRGPMDVLGGEDELTSFLIERIESLGGQVMRDERVVALNPNQRDNHELILDDLTAVIGATFVVTTGHGEQLARLSRGRGVTRSAQRHWPVVEEKAGRFCVSVVADTAGIPDALGVHTLLFPHHPGARGSARSPVLHLLRIDEPPANEQSQPPRTVLVVELLRDNSGLLPRNEARQVVLDLLLNQFPFLDRHLHVVDSVHDGLPVWVFDGGKRSEVDRLETRGADRTEEPMVPLLDVDTFGFAGLEGEPVRGPIPRTFLIGPSVLPALGQEGELLAAWGAANIITRSDKSRARLRRSMWSRIEFG